MGRRGVTAFTDAALRLGWFVREQHESDQGIDAQVEKVNLVERKNRPPREDATGRLIAVQIKGGESWFKAPTKTGGWWFSFSERERNLWLNHALPVIVAMYHPEHDKVYWQRISAATISKARTKYRVEVPEHQTVETAGDVWAEIASGDERRALDLFELSVRGVSPAIAKELRERADTEHPDAAVLAMHLAEGRMNPRGSAAALLTSKPRWIADNAAWAWSLVAHYCSDHDQMDLAADAFERSADANEGRVRTRALVAAATHRCSHDLIAARDLMSLADQTDIEPVIRAVGRTVVAGSDDDGHWNLDPLLVAGGPDIEKSASAQRLLCGQARAEERFGDAVAHSEAALKLDPLSSMTMVMLGESLLGRWTLEGAATSDLLRGIDLFREAIEQRTAWAGRVEHIRYGLVRALGMAGDFDAVVRLALPAPAGDATADEVDPKAVRIAAYAAHRIGDTDARDQAVSLLADEPEDRLAKAHAGALELTQKEENALRLIALDAAEDARSYNEFAEYCLMLSSDGVDVISRLRPNVESGVLPESMLRLCEALVIIPTQGLDAALPALRELAKTDSIAAEHLLGRLREARRFAEAAEQAKSLFELTNSAPYLLHQARALAGADDLDAAAAVATRAVALNDIRSNDRAEMLDFLGQVSGEKKDWALGEMYFAQAIELLAHPGPNLIWNLVACQVQQGRIAKAAQTVAKYRPPVRDRRDAELWLRANAAEMWDERTAFEAFALAQRFVEDPQLSTALVGAIVTRTHGVGGPGDEHEDDDLQARRLAAQNAVPAELHRQAFEFIGQLVDRHGERTGIRVLKGFDEQQMLDLMVAQLKQASAADEGKREIAQLARDGRIPVGFLAAAFGRSTATLEAQRALGIRLASSIFDDEHQLEVDAAQKALNTSVVVDSATVITLTGLTDPDSLTGAFLVLRTSPATMLDLHRFSDDVRAMAGSPGSIHWDEDLDRVVVTELTDDEFMRLLKRSESVQGYLDRLAVRTPGPATIYRDLHDDESQAVWLDVLQLAVDDGAVVWSDDLGLRRAAREVGIDAFGTSALVDVLRDMAIASAGDDQEGVWKAIKVAYARVFELGRDHMVDVMLRVEDVYRLAEEGGWRPGAAAIALSRRSLWAWNENALALLRVIYKKARSAAPETLAEWQLAGMHGAAGAQQSEAAAAVLAVLALIAFDDQPDDAERADSLQRARRVATELGLPDPAGGLPRAAALIAEGAGTDDPDALVKRVLELVEEPEPEGGDPQDGVDDDN
jgi:hypothetical protein